MQTKTPTQLVLETRYGPMWVFREDQYVGKSLIEYGEYSESEVEVCRRCLKPGDVAMDVGANIGALTVPMAQLVGEDGCVIAIEPQPHAVDLLTLNAAPYPQVKIMLVAAGDGFGVSHVESLDDLTHKNFGHVVLGAGRYAVPIVPIDSLNLDKLKFLKVDVEGAEMQVLNGARETIARCRPIMYVENNREDLSRDLIGLITDMGYRCYWHRPYLYHKDNFKNNPTNHFGFTVSINMLCVHEESGIKIGELDEVADLRPDAHIFTREIARYKRIVENDPSDLMTRAHMAHYMNMMGFHQQAMMALEENLKVDPTHAMTRNVLALQRLQQGIFDWDAYEARYDQQNTAIFGGARKFNIPRWDGTPTNERVLIWDEQGFGDSIMFARFMRNVLERAPNAIMDVKPELFELFEYSRVTPEGRLYRRNREMPAFAYHCSMPSLPAVLKIGSNVGMDGPYLFADQMLVNKWRDQQAWANDVRGLPLIGLCWEGGTASERPFTRNLPIQFAEQIADAAQRVISLKQIGQFYNYAETAACMASMDLVITVDTSIAHLAGAMGIPTWLLLSMEPDFRWMLKRSDSPWYPSMTIFRQDQFNVWEPVVERVIAGLKEMTFAQAQAAE